MRRGRRRGFFEALLMLMRIHLDLYIYIIARGESIASRYTFRIRRMLFLKFASSSSSCPTKIEGGVEDLRDLFTCSVRKERVRAYLERPGFTNTAARVPVDNTLLHQLSGFLSPLFLSTILLLPSIFDSTSVHSFFHLDLLSLLLPRRVSPPLRSSIPRSTPAKLSPPLCLLRVALPPPPDRPPFLRLGARSGHWSCYNPESADGRPMYGSLFYAGCAALRCTPRRARGCSPRTERCGSKHARMYPPRISPRRAFERPAARWPILSSPPPSSSIDRCTKFLKKGMELSYSYSTSFVSKVYSLLFSLLLPLDA